MPLLSAGLLAPVPLSNVPPASAIMLIAYLEEDGILLCAALAAALAMLAAAAMLVREAMGTADWVPSLLQGAAAVRAAGPREV